MQNNHHLILTLTAGIVSAYVAKNPISPTELPSFIGKVHSTLGDLAADKVMETAREPAVPIKKSVGADFIICLENGKKFKSLKRHLGTLGLTPDEYRAKWGLPADYPMVAPNYAAARSELAKQMGLGRKPARSFK